MTRWTIKISKWELPLIASFGLGLPCAVGGVLLGCWFTDLTGIHGFRPMLAGTFISCSLYLLALSRFEIVD